MDKDGSIDLDAIEGQVRSLIANDVKGAFVCGSTGESMSLTVEERMEVASRWCEVADDDLIIIVHAGHTALPACKALAAHAETCGADAIAAIPPFFFKPEAVADLVGFFAEVTAAAPETPFYYYHIPSRTGVPLSITRFLTEGRERIPTLAGAKFTYEDLGDFGNCVELDGGAFNMLFGRDEMLLAGLAMGADGAVGTSYSFAAPLYNELIAAFRAGDLETARRKQDRARQMIALFHDYPAIAGPKAMMEMIGVDCGPARRPLRRLSDEQRDRLRADLERIGFFDYCSSAG